MLLTVSDWEAYWRRLFACSKDKINPAKAINRALKAWVDTYDKAALLAGLFNLITDRTIEIVAEDQSEESTC